MWPPCNSVEELLACWDRGESIWSLSMGGLGPSYEQAIQVAAVEFARAGKSLVCSGDSKADYASFDQLCNEALRAIDDRLGGITGAMYGAAKWLAWQWCFEGGPDRLCEKAREQGEAARLIQVSSAWPRI